MSTLRRVLRTSGLVLAGQLFARATGAVVFFSMARLLGKTELGRFSFVAAYVAIFQVMADLGLQQIVVREVARGKSDGASTVFNAVMMRLVFGSIACTLILTLLPWVRSDDHSGEVRWMVVAGCVWILSYSVQPLGAVFKARMRMDMPVMANAIGNTSYVVLAVIAMLLVRRAWAPWMALVVSSVVPGLAIGLAGARMLVPDPRPSLASLRSLLSSSWPLAMNSFLMVIYNRVDQVMIQHYRGATELAGYAAAVKLMELWNVVPLSLMAAIFPLLARYAGDQRDKYRDVLRRTIQVLMIVIVGAVPFVVRYGGWGLGVIYGPAFVSAHKTLVILTAAELFLYLLYVFRDAFVSEGRERLVLVFAASTMAVNVVLNVILIPRMGIEGAAWATLCALACVLILAVAIREVRYYGRLALAALVRPTAAAAVSASVLWLLRERPVIAFVAALLAYALALLAVRTFDRRDLELAREVLRRRSPPSPVS